MADSISDPPVLTGDARPPVQRVGSVSQASEKSQTAQEFISSQLQLEADAREALPYQFDTCTRPLGPLRQLLFSCLTCNPPPSEPSAPYTPAGVCYSCSISCHGKHTLVELFNKRNFECDCGTTRMPSTEPCTLRPDARGRRGGVTGDKPAEGNKYNKNFGNRFCGCGEEYNAHTEKGTMFQCLGLGSVEDGGCGEDWWHPECLVGLPRGWWRKDVAKAKTDAETRNEEANGEVSGDAVETAHDEDDPPLPPGFPSEDDFDGLLCYKCVNTFPWIKRYAGTDGFLPAVYHNPPTGEQPSVTATASRAESRKRKAEDDDDEEEEEEEEDSSSAKRQRSSLEDPTSKQAPIQKTLGAGEETETTNGTTAPPAPSPPTCLYSTLPPTQTGGAFSILLQPTFRENLCHCPTHFPLLTPHPQLLDEEEIYEPPLSESSEGGGRPQSAGSKSLLDRGEAALSNMDRVRAIEGVMVYNHLRGKVKDFLQPFAESGKVVGAEDIKKYFETLRGDAEAMRAMRAQQEAAGGDGDGEGDNRREQGGY